MILTEVYENVYIGRFLIMERIEVRAYLDPSRNFELSLYARSGKSFGTVVFDPLPSDVNFGCSPLFSLDKSASQSLMDDLWSSGIRPSEGSGSAGSLCATQAHLSDMRLIVGSKLGIALK